jgi:hypothetical protein
MTRTHRYRGRAEKQRASAVIHPLSMVARAGHGDAGGSSLTLFTRVAAPADADRELMASLAIGFEGGVYRFEGMRFERLADAVGHARFAMQHQEDAGGR